MQHNTMDGKPNQTYRFHFLGQFHRIHRVLEQKKEDTQHKKMDDENDDDAAASTALLHTESRLVWLVIVSESQQVTFILCT